ncbi:shikimate dehydrogenase [Cellulomonas sp. NPDC089187]|uniref:shikimate dehydrogenase n=1 Tax=Cellulomonas sp. NPDC089187 TaxID=3154970 RepID=UPI00343E3D5B
MSEQTARRAAVLGHPIGHSLSPRLHRAAYAALGLESWQYTAIDLTEEQLPAFIAGLDDSWAGLSVTMPLKQAVMGLVDHVEPLASVVGAVNTVLVQGGGRRPTLVGANTDVHGIVAALREGGSGGTASTAAVLGAGATASAALAALAELGCAEPVVYVRSLGRTGALALAAHRMGVHPVFRPLAEAATGILDVDLVVSTLPPGGADFLVPEVAGRQVAGVLLDAAYDPRRSAVGAAWAGAGGSTVDGERMLLHQAVEQVRLMTGQPGPLTAMDAALGDALG